MIRIEKFREQDKTRKQSIFFVYSRSPFKQNWKKIWKKTDSVENVESPGAAQKRDISSEDNIKKESQQFSYYVQDLLHSTNKETNKENNVTQKEVDKQNLKLEKNETLYKNLCQKNETKYEKGKRYFSVMTRNES